MFNLPMVLLLLLLAAAVYFDVQSGRIPNKLILCGMGCAFAVRIFACILAVSMTHAISRDIVWLLVGGMVGTVLPYAILLVLYYFRMIGAGDIKLLCMCGAFLGPVDVLKCTVISFLIGGVISFILLIIRGNVHSRFQYFFQYVYEAGILRHRKSYLAGVDRSGRFCFSIPIFISVILRIGGVY